MTFSIQVGSVYLFSVRKKKKKVPSKFQIGPKMSYYHPKEQKTTSRATLATFPGRPNPRWQNLDAFFRNIMLVVVLRPTTM